MTTPNRPNSPASISHMRTPPNTMNFRNRQVCLLANHFQNSDIASRVLSQGSFFQVAGPTIIYCKTMVSATDPEIACVGADIPSIKEVQISLTTHRDFTAPAESACKLVVSFSSYDDQGRIMPIFSYSFEICIPLVRPSGKFYLPLVPAQDTWDGPDGIILGLKQAFKVNYTCEGVERTPKEKRRVDGELSLGIYL